MSQTVDSQQSLVTSGNAASNIILTKTYRPCYQLHALLTDFNETRPLFFDVFLGFLCVNVLYSVLCFV